MRLSPLLVIVLLGLLTAVAGLQAQDKPQDLILGKWDPVDEKGKSTVEFLKDGKLRISAQQLTLEGSYKFLDDKTIETRVIFAGKEEKGLKLAIKVTKDELVTTHLEGTKTEQRFTRHKD
jgi:uncharacterized protein (TIGR03066 family)